MEYKDGILPTIPVTTFGTDHSTLVLLHGLDDTVTGSPFSNTLSSFPFSWSYKKKSTPLRVTSFELDSVPTSNIVFLTTERKMFREMVIPRKSVKCTGINME